MRILPAVFGRLPLRRIVETMLIYATGSGFVLLFNALLTRQFGAAQTGIFYLALVVTSIAATVSRLGLEMVTLRQIALAVAGGRTEAARRVAWVAGGICLGTGLLSGAALFAVRRPLAGTVFHNPEMAPSLGLAAMAVPAAALALLLSAALKGAGRPRTGMATISATTYLVAGAVLAWGGTHVDDPFMAYLAGIVATCGIAIAVLGTVLRKPGAGPSPSAAALFREGRPFIAVNLLSLVSSWTDILMLGALSTAEQVGLFGVANRLAMMLAFGLSAVNTVISGEVAVANAGGDTARIQRLSQSTARIMLTCVTPVFLIYLLFPGPIFSIFKLQLAASGGVLAWLAVGQMVNIGAGSVSLVLSLSGRGRSLRNMMLLAAGVNAFLNWVLIPHWHALGAAVATCTSTVVLNLSLVAYCRREMGIRTSVI